MGFELKTQSSSQGWMRWSWNDTRETEAEMVGSRPSPTLETGAEFQSYLGLSYWETVSETLSLSKPQRPGMDLMPLGGLFQVNVAEIELDVKSSWPFLQDTPLLSLPASGQRAGPPIR